MDLLWILALTIGILSDYFIVLCISRGAEMVDELWRYLELDRILAISIPILIVLSIIVAYGAARIIFLEQNVNTGTSLLAYLIGIWALIFSVIYGQKQKRYFDRKFEELKQLILANR